MTEEEKKMTEKNDKTRSKSIWAIVWKQSLTNAKIADDQYRDEIDLMLMVGLLIWLFMIGEFF